MPFQDSMDILHTYQVLMCIQMASFSLLQLFPTSGKSVRLLRGTSQGYMQSALRFIQLLIKSKVSLKSLIPILEPQLSCLISIYSQGLRHHHLPLDIFWAEEGSSFDGASGACQDSAFGLVSLWKKIYRCAQVKERLVDVITEHGMTIEEGMVEDLSHLIIYLSPL